MNDIAKRATMEKLAHTIEVEKLTNKAEIGRALGISGNYISMILNEKAWVKCHKSAWEAVLNWLNSGYTLSQYKEKYPVKVEPKSEVKKEYKNIDTDSLKKESDNIDMIEIKPIADARKLSDFSDHELCDELRSRGYIGKIEIKKSITI